MPFSKAESTPPPPLPKNMPDEQRVAAWADWLDTCEQFLLAGMRRRIGPEGDLQAEFRRWYEERMAESRKKWVNIGRHLKRGESRAG